MTAESLEQRLRVHGPSRTHRIESPSPGILNPVDCPLSQIANVNDIDRRRWITGGQNFSALLRTRRPVGERSDRITGTNDIARTQNQRLGRKLLLGFALTKHFELTV